MLSQVTTTPDAVKTGFDRDRDQSQVIRLLHAGCAHMGKASELEDINIDDLIATAMDDPQAISGSKALRGINFADLQTKSAVLQEREGGSTVVRRSRRRHRFLQQGGGNSPAISWLIHLLYISALLAAG